MKCRLATPLVQHVGIRVPPAKEFNQVVRNPCGCCRCCRPIAEAVTSVAIMGYTCCGQFLFDSSHKDTSSQRRLVQKWGLKLVGEPLGSLIELHRGDPSALPRKISTPLPKWSFLAL